MKIKEENIQNDQNKSKKLKESNGYTLIELLVSIAIFTLITTIAVFNHNKFNSSVLLTNLAYEVALSIRQAQFYGISVKQATGGSFGSGYGVYFSLEVQEDRIKYILFEDVNVNGIYEVSDTILETFNIQKGNYFSKICISQLGGDSNCDINKASISFKRPDPDASIKAESGGGLPIDNIKKAEICIFSPQGNHRKVIIENTGQISVSLNTSICNN